LYILGISAEQADVSAALVRDGDLVAALEEERFSRVKHCRGFPHEAVRRCLAIAGISGAELDHVAVSGDPRCHLARRVRVALGRPSPNGVRRRIAAVAADRQLGNRLARALGVPPDSLPSIHRVEHHLAHLASAYLVSPFQSAAVCSADGFGDLVSTMTGEGREDRLRVLHRVYFPHSLGLLYSALTSYLGFEWHGDEYKVMGLAACGCPEYERELGRLVALTSEGAFRLDWSYFRPWREWHGGGRGRPGTRPALGRLHGPKLEELLGPPRLPEDEISERHANIACSLQLVFERALLHALQGLWERTRNSRLCVAGGCFANSVLNGKIREATRFEELYVQPATGDSGLAVGAAYAVWCEALGRPRTYVMRDAYLGTAYPERELEAALEPVRTESRRFEVDRGLDSDDLCRRVAALIADGAVVGWFQGRMEWGSRALGSRSILADPRRADMRDRINAQIKRRESFRPFAPSLLESALDEWFVGAAPDPFMVSVRPVRPE
jgi:carbamoyltransferase